MKRPQIAWVFSRDTIYPKQKNIFDVLRFIEWVFIDNCRVDLDYNPSNDTHAALLFIEGLRRVENSEAIKWLSDRLGTNFVDFVGNMFLDLYEKGGLRFVIDSYDIGLGAYFYDSEMKVEGIDFSNRTMLIGRLMTREESKAYPIEKALEMMNVSWKAVLRTFGLSVMLIKHKEEVIREVNRLIKDDALIDIGLHVVPYIKDGKYAYGMFICVAHADKVCIPLKVKSWQRYQFLKHYTIYSSNNKGILFDSLLEYVRTGTGYQIREICYSPVRGEAFLVDPDKDIRLPIDIKSMQIVFKDVWLSFAEIMKMGDRVVRGRRLSHTKKAIKAMIEGIAEREKQT